MKYWAQKGHPLYETYKCFMAMKDRARNPTKNPKNKDYYLNVDICAKWLVRKQGFLDFLETMGERPGPNFTIDRIDSTKGYFPDNCRWADKTQQTYNSKLRSDNTSGCKGVWWEKNLKKWRACLQYKGKRISLGCFKDKKEAIKAYENAKKKVVK